MSRDRVHLLYIEHSIARIQHLTLDGEEAFAADEDKQAAILYYLQTLSESTTRLSEELRFTNRRLNGTRYGAFVTALHRTILELT